MPRPAKGPRLYLRRARIDRRTGGEIGAVYVIRDGGREVSTGHGPDRLRDAEGALLAYLERKRAIPQASSLSRRDPDKVAVASVLALYALEKAPRESDPISVAGWIETLLDWWGDKVLSDVRRSACEAYVRWRTAQPNRNYSDPATAPRVSAQTARRELETLSSAIGYWDGEHHLSRRPAVHLPMKPETSRDALTRSQAASLLLAAMGWRKGPHGRWTRLQASSRTNRAHMRRFILIGLYTGTRPGVIPKLLWSASDKQAWVDLDAGMIYRRGKLERDQKTKRRPVVKLPPRLLAHLRRWRRMDAEREATLRVLDPAARLSHVIHHGGVPLAGRVRTGFEGCVRDAGLEPETTPHWLRHTAATWLMEAGVDVWLSAAYLGMTPETLIKVYGHVRPDYQAEAAGSFSRR
mgnify:CR=1 FL=1